MLLLDGLIFALQPAGGISTVFARLVAHTQARGRAFALLDPDNGHASANIERRRLALAPPCERVVTQESRATLLLDQSCRLRVPPALAERVTVFESSYFRFFDPRRVANLAMVHDCIPEQCFAPPRRQLFALLRRRQLAAAKLVVCVSRATRDELLRRYPQASRLPVEVVPNGFEPFERVDANPSVLPSIEDESAVPATQGAVLFVGARAGYKRFALAVEAVAATAGLRLTMVGGGAPDQDEQRLLERRLPGRHVWAGAVSRPALGRMLEAAHALVYCSSTEGFGIPLLEAQAQGCPVVCSDIPVFREVAGAGARYVRDADAAAYAAALEDLKQPQLREELTEAGRVNAARFSWQRSMRLHAELLDALGGRTG